MPNRILKETIKLSNQIDQLNWFEEVLFYRLIVTADDYGCLDGRTVVLKNSLFPTKDMVTKKAIEEGIDRLASVGLLRKYVVNGMPYLFLPTWEKHQRIRNKQRKFPEPPLDTDMSTNDGQASEESCLNPIQSKTKSESKLACAKRFARFWQQYPKKKDKPAAERAWNKIHPDDELTDFIIASVIRNAATKDWQKENGQYIPYPATYLNGHRWEDEVTIATERYSNLERLSIEIAQEENA